MIFVTDLSTILKLPEYNADAMKHGVFTLYKILFIYIYIYIYLWYIWCNKKKVNQSRYRSGVAQRVPGS